MLLTEAALGPEIDASFAWPFLCELGDGCSLGPEEGCECEEPEPEGDGAGGGDGGDEVEIGDGHDEEQDEIAAAEDPFEARFVFAGWDGSRHRGKLADRWWEVGSVRCPRVPHISLVVREMWDSTDLDRTSSMLNEVGFFL